MQGPILKHFNPNTMLKQRRGNAVHLGKFHCTLAQNVTTAYIGFSIGDQVRNAEFRPIKLLRAIIFDQANLTPTTEGPYSGHLVGLDISCDASTQQYATCFDPENLSSGMLIKNS